MQFLFQGKDEKNNALHVRENITVALCLPRWHLDVMVLVGV